MKIGEARHGGGRARRSCVGPKAPSRLIWPRSRSAAPEVCSTSSGVRTTILMGAECLEIRKLPDILTLDVEK